jgi:hypothetical protein
MRFLTLNSRFINTTAHGGWWWRSSPSTKTSAIAFMYISPFIELLYDWNEFVQCCFIVSVETIYITHALSTPLHSVGLQVYFTTPSLVSNSRNDCFYSINFM